MATMAAPKALILLHTEHSSPGRIGRLLQREGVSLDIRRPSCGDPLPNTLDEHCAVVAFGGPMSVNDADEWIAREIDWMETPLKAGKPFLGICLGGQMLARCLGQSVRRHPAGLTEVGYYPIYPTEQSQNHFGGDMPKMVYQWHNEGFGLPCGAERLAVGDDFETQAFCYGTNAVALQFHPEVTYATMCRWTVHAPQQTQTLNAQPPQSHLEGWFQYDRAVALWLDGFLPRWLRQSPATIETLWRASADMRRDNASYAVAAE